MKLTAADITRLQEWGLHTRGTPKVQDADLLRRLRMEHQRLEVGRNYSEMLVTPGLARQWLDNSMPLQHLSKTLINEYAELIRTGRWKVEPNNPIRFDATGRLIDGQHRLHACILADTPFDSPVVHITDHGAWAQVGAKISNIAHQTATRLSRAKGKDEIEQEVQRALFRALSEHAMEHAR